MFDIRQTHKTVGCPQTFGCLKPSMPKCFLRPQWKNTYDVHIFISRILRFSLYNLRGLPGLPPPSEGAPLRANQEQLDACII